MGWFGDLVNQAAHQTAQQATQAITNEAKARLSALGTSAHIPAQNETAAAFADVVNRYHAGQLTAAQAASQINYWNSTFQALVRSLGYARALAGGRDIDANAQNILRSLGQPSTLPGSSVPIPAPSAPGGGLTSVFGGLSPEAILALLVIGGFLLLRKR